MDFKIEIVNVHEFKGDHVYVGRGSPLGNPFSNRSSNFETVKVSSRDEAIDQYRIWLKEQLKFNTPQTRAIAECVAKLVANKKIVLGCFCTPLRCHAEVIAEFLAIEMDKVESEWKAIFE
jgi:hypothetical protein